MGGSPKSGGSVSNTSTQRISQSDPIGDPQRTEIVKRGRTLFDNGGFRAPKIDGQYDYIGMTDPQRRAMQGVVNLVDGGNQALDTGLDGLMSTARGDNLMNPYLQETLSQIQADSARTFYDQVLPGVQSGAAMAGRGRRDGNVSGLVTAMEMDKREQAARGLQGDLAGTFMNAYNTGRGMQQQAQSMLLDPSIRQQQFAEYDRMAEAGAMERSDLMAARDAMVRKALNTDSNVLGQRELQDFAQFVNAVGSGSSNQVIKTEGRQTAAAPSGGSNFGTQAIGAGAMAADMLGG